MVILIIDYLMIISMISQRLFHWLISRLTDYQLLQLLKEYLQPFVHHGPVKAISTLDAMRQKWDELHRNGGFDTKSNQITFIVTSPQHMCLGEWNSWERAPDSAKTIYL